MDRPDPDALLAQVQADEAKARRGKLKIFFGANAGVGKTYAMLAAARQAQAQGRAVLVGVVETHGRADTEAMARDLPRLPLKEIAYRGQTLKEFDLDGALAFEAEHPEGVLLLDELAHSNAPGSRHPKRWQDVQELLDGGVDVWSTLNVQHLESLNDIVGGITGIRVAETLPDRVFDEADEVVLVDIPPDELLARLQAGKVYLPQQAERAAKHFFRKGNLLALRELALRRTADRVDDEMLAYRRQQAVPTVWPNRESLLACVGGGGHGEKVVRSCARLATQLGVSWHAVHVERSGRREAGAQRQQLQRVLKLAQELGATTATLNDPEPAEALLRYARAHNLSRLVLGRQEGRGWGGLRWPGQRSLAETLSLSADDIDVLQVALPAQVQPPLRGGTEPEPAAPWRWQGYAWALAICALTTLLAAPLTQVLRETNVVMLYLAAVLGVALWQGRGPAVLAAFVGVGAFDFFFVEPRLSFAVRDAEYLITFALMLTVALVTGQLTAGLKAQALAAQARERRMRALYEMARELSAALVPEQVAELGARFLRGEFQARSALWALDSRDRLLPLPGADFAPDEGLARWAFDHAQPAGAGTDTLPASPHLVLPLKAPMRTRGVLALQLSAGRGLGPEERQLLDTCAALLALSLERIHYVEVAQASTVQIESERLRNTLLAAISHDLRTPLASLVGLADTLLLTQPNAAQTELAVAMQQSSRRMAAMVANLLDMARLQAGAVPLNRQSLPLEELIGAARSTLGDALRPWPLTVQQPLPLVFVDGPLFERVLVNLLENASKYTPPGTPLSVGAQRDGDVMRIRFEDRGPGLPRHLQGREALLFDKFERGDREGSTPGVGLGLALCKAIVEAHGGRIEAGPVEPSGVRFTLTLPLEPN